MNIGIIGLGKLGKPTSEVLIEEGHNVKGYDINGDGVSSIKECVSNTDIVFVAVPTPHDPQYDGKHPCSHLEPKDFDYTIVKEVINEANKYMNKTQILVLISTVLPGTIRKHLLPVAKKTNLVYNPYLIAMGSVKWDIRNPEMIMIGGKTRYCNILENFYRDLCNCDRYIIGTYEECESIKIFYNTFISTKLAIVNMIQDVAVKLGNMNVDVVTDALANSTQRIMSPKYMKAGMGDGGSCHPRDNIALRKLAKDLNLGYDLFDAIISTREKQAKNMACEILKHGNKIMFSSNAFKPGVKIEDGSYSLLVQFYIKELGGWIVNDNPHVYVLVHPDDKPKDNVYNFDPWNNYGNNK
tara:strand:+ start:18206 stop:19267 length:1062 start_codon:yes stop_codon:yes gene_type:complete